MAESRASSRPLTVAHRAGNELSLLSEAFAVGVDYAEADVWLYHGRLEVRHDKTAGPLPILWDRWSLKPGWTRRLLLSDVLAAAGGQGDLFLDLKGEAQGLTDAVAEAVERAGAAESVAFSSPNWSYLDQLSTLVPQAPRFYTVGKPQALAALRPRLERGEISAVSINSRFLTEETVSELREGGARTIVTWAVETPEAARRVLAWGVGVTSKSLSLLAAIRSGELGSSRA